MNIEALDGFFAALIAGPETVVPSEYYREVFGGEMSDGGTFSSLEEANSREIFGLMMRHWNDIAGHCPGRVVNVRAPAGEFAGTAGWRGRQQFWARGFMQRHGRAPRRMG